MKKSSPTRVGVKICRGVPVRGETICLDIGSGRIGVKIRRSVPFRGEKICLEIGSGRVGIKSFRGVTVRGEKNLAPQGTSPNQMLFSPKCTYRVYSILRHL